MVNSTVRDPRQDEVDQDGWELWGQDDITADLLMEAIEARAEPQRVESIFRELMDEVIEIERHDGWFDWVGIVNDVPFIVIRYQWWPSGWHYRLVNPRWEASYRAMM